jgi:non-canonical (house-cleaning) NTP pyrophosphatase
MMFVLFSAPRLQVCLKKTSAEFGVGIENGAARKRERETESLKKLIEVNSITGI